MATALIVYAGLTGNTEGCRYFSRSIEERGIDGHEKMYFKRKQAIP